MLRTRAIFVLKEKLGTNYQLTESNLTWLCKLRFTDFPYFRTILSPSCRTWLQYPWIIDVLKQDSKLIVTVLINQWFFFQIDISLTDSVQKATFVALRLGTGSRDHGFDGFKSGIDSNAHILLNVCVISLP